MAFFCEYGDNCGTIVIWVKAIRQDFSAGCEITGFPVVRDTQKPIFLQRFPTGKPVKIKICESQNLDKAFLV